MEQRYFKKRLEQAEGIISRSPIIAFVWKNAEGWPVEYVSDNVQTIFGWDKNDFLDNRIDYAQVVHPDDLPRVTGEVHRCSVDRSTGKVIHKPYRIVTRDGSVKWVEDLTTILRNEDGSVAAYEGILLDITEHKQAERERERLQADLVNAVEIANLGPWEHDLVKDVFILNDYFYRIYHTTAEQVGGYTMSPDEFIRRFTHPDDIPLVLEDMRKASEKADSLSNQQYEYRFLYPDGKVGYAAIRIVFVKDSSGKAIKAYGVTQDITERKIAERERLSNLHFFESTDRVNRAIQAADSVERMTHDVLDAVLSIFICDRAFLLHPCDPDSAVWTVTMERHRPECPGAFEIGGDMPMSETMSHMIRAVLESGHALSFGAGADHPLPEGVAESYQVKSSMALALYPKVGKPWLFCIHQCSHPRTWNTEEEKLFQEIGRRLSDGLTSLLMDRDLRKSEAFLSSILENIPDTIFVKDANTLKFVQINRAGEKMMGCSREKLIGKNSYDLSPEAHAKAFEEKERGVIRGKRLVDIPEEELITPANETHVLHTKLIPLFDDAGKPQYLLGIAEDITELKKLQAQLNQNQKMEALGAVSGGIAHDFNNLLQPIVGFCELLKADLPADSPLQGFVDGIFKSGVRAKDLVNQILAFSRQSEHRMVRVDIQPILKEVVKLCRSTIPSNIEITRYIQNDCAGVLADPTQVHQILMNLMVNAYHAMDASGGKISVRLKETALGGEDLKDVTVPPGPYAMISVSDTGCGMAPEVLEKIFEPYFTTKAEGKGTGMGLAVVYGIVREHNGHLTVTSEVGEGSTFNVYLPIAEKRSEVPSEEKTETFQTGDERILLVDDEETIIGLETVILERFGYRVIACRNGADALEIFGANPDAFDLVITDMAMPNMTGDVLLKALLAIRPDLPVIICTGYSEKISMDEAKSIGAREFLMKPLSVTEITRKVRKALDESRLLKT